MENYTLIFRTDNHVKYLQALVQCTCNKETRALPVVGGFIMIILFLILMFMLFGKMIVFGIKAAWGLGKFMIGLILLPILIIGVLAAGLIYLALPLLAIAGVVLLIKSAAKAV